MEKLYKKIGWKNRPNASTPLGATNLKKIDEALDGLDNRTIELDNKDAEQGRHIEGLYAETRKNTQAIESGFDALKIVPTASGSPVYIFDASNMNNEGIDFLGESKQMQTTGAQLANYGPAIYDDKSGLSIDLLPDGGIKVVGTPTASSIQILFLRITLPAETYFISGGVAEAGNIYANVNYKSNASASTYKNVNNGAFTLEEEMSVNLTVATTSSKNPINTVIYPMLNAGSTALPFEPYTGGKASPNPDYPQPIESKIVNQVVVLSTNQMPNEMKSQTIGGLTIDSNSERIKVTGTTTTTVKVNVYAKKIESKNGLFIKGATKLEGLYYMVMASDNSTGAVKYWEIGTNGYYIAAGWTIERVYIQQINANVTVNAEIQPQIVVGNVDLPFEPYQSQTVNLSEPIELNGFGGVRDSSKLKKFGVVVFDGSDDENWKASITSVEGKYRNTTSFLKNLAKPYDITVVGNLFCTHYKAVASNSAGTWGTKQGMCIDGSSTVMVYDDNFNTEDVSLWKAHLQANPMTVVYELAEPIETALPQADIDAIKNLHTYKPNTVVMNDADAEMDVHYVADAKTYIDKKFRELATVIVNQ